MSERDHEVAVLGVGMHPWGKWGRNFVEYGLAAAGDALTDAGVTWDDIEFVSGADTIRNGYPGFVSGSTFAQALGWSGTPIASCYAACASGAHALEIARTRILAGLCDVALVVADVEAGAVSREGAARDYGVVLVDGTTDVDEQATAARRQALANGVGTGSREAGTPPSSERTAATRACSFSIVAFSVIGMSSRTRSAPSGEIARSAISASVRGNSMTLSA